MTDRDTVIEKIKKLLALGESPNQHEAEMAMQKASDLMERYMVDEAEVALREAKQDGVVEKKYVVPNLRMKLLWVEVLGQAAAALYGCRALVYTNELHGTSVGFVGFSADVEAAVATFEHLWESWHGIVKRDLNKRKKDFKEMDKFYGASTTWAPRDTMKFKHGHGQGYANTLLVRANEIRKNRENSVKATGSTGTELVLVRETKVEEYMQNVKRAKTRHATQGDKSGVAAGQKAGREIPLGAVGTTKLVEG